MLSMAVQPSVNTSLKPLTLPTHKPFLNPIKASISAKQNPSFAQLFLAQRPRKSRFSASAAIAEDSVAEETALDEIPTKAPPEKEVG